MYQRRLYHDLCLFGLLLSAGLDGAYSLKFMVMVHRLTAIWMKAGPHGLPWQAILDMKEMTASFSLQPSAELTITDCHDNVLIEVPRSV
jgi:hypothetical protein